jgi:sporulation protein YlmC with PRC-barrel domain
MNRLAAGSVAALLIGTPAVGQQSSKILSNVPGQSVTVTDWYKQSVYDVSNSKIGDVRDVLLSADGKVSAVIVGVGGFLGMGEKNVAVPFDAITTAMRRRGCRTPAKGIEPGRRLKRTWGSNQLKKDGFDDDKARLHRRDQCARVSELGTG